MPEPEKRAGAADIDERLLKPYNPSEVENRIYQLWEKSGYFNPEQCIKDGVADLSRPPFAMVLPPPNVTGSLHMGSAFMLAIEDVMVRFARMQGRPTLWIPGTDHAAIATQAKVETMLYKEEHKRRHDIGREAFLKRVEAFATESHDAIIGQIRKTGCSIDWSREAFTLDEKRSLAVRTAFKRLYESGLIYRGYRIVNWDPKGQTTISDDEIIYQPEKTTLYTFRYSKDFPIAIATTRPETKVGDTAVAVHPSDKRYQKFVGKEFDVRFAGEMLHLKIVADEAVDPAFGTGAVGVTPAHSVADWEIAARHHLPLVPVIDEYARMAVTSEALQGKKASEARSIVVDWLTKEGLIEKQEAIEHNVATAERTGGIVEPLPKLQWFIDVNKKFKNQSEKIKGIKKGQQVSLKELILAPVKNGQIRIVPERFEKVYFHWAENLRDWCISRQIWYGHRIPVWYRSADGKSGQEVYCGIEKPEGEGWEQDPDTLDTWFSSGLWTFSTLGWPEETADLERYHPMTVLETGYDILFFWVARMILMSTYLLGDIPFETVYLHGLVRDKNGNKISKSLGNNIDPQEIIAKYGADAMRMSLIIGTGPGNDSKLSEEKLKAYKHFANKLWNITRFVLHNAPSSEPRSEESETDLKLRAEFDALIADVTEDMQQYRLHLAADKLYQYVWHTFADKILEESKLVLGNGTALEQSSRRHFLRETLIDILILLHPFMPFITEELWSVLAKNAPREEKTLLIARSWPRTIA